MENNNFDDFDSIDELVNDEFFILKESKETNKYSDKRRRLEDLLEEKRLRAELDEFDGYFRKNTSLDNDDMPYN